MTPLLADTAATYLDEIQQKIANNPKTSEFVFYYNTAQGKFVISFQHSEDGLVRDESQFLGKLLLRTFETL